MKRLLIILAVMLLAVPCFGKVVGGIGIGANLDNVKNPGFAVQTGVQEQVSDNIYTRLLFNKMNMGDAVAIDNIGMTWIYFTGISKKADFGVRLLGDRETDGDQYGWGVGFEFDFFDIKLPIAVPVISNNLGAYIAVDMLTRPESQRYFQFGIGISFLDQ